MKITKSEPNVLEVKDISIAPFILGAILIIIGGISMLIPSAYPGLVPEIVIRIFFPVCTGVGLLTILTTPYVTTSFSKEDLHVRVVRANFIFRKRSLYGFDEVKSVWLEEHSLYNSAKPKAKPKIQASCYLLLRNGYQARFTLKKFSSSHWILGLIPVGVEAQANDKAILVAIANFLGRPFMSFAPPSGSGIADIPLEPMEKSMNIEEPEIVPPKLDDSEDEPQVTPDKANPEPPLPAGLPKFQPSGPRVPIPPAPKPTQKPVPNPKAKPAPKPAPTKKKGKK
jgi:hypothetical protein